jgi:hypothetical protein
MSNRSYKATKCFYSTRELPLTVYLGHSPRHLTAFQPIAGTKLALFTMHLENDPILEKKLALPQNAR